MADPTITSLAAGQGATGSATTTVSFTGQAVGTLLVLSYAGDDYHTTSGTGRPESTGWTNATSQRGAGQEHGSAIWYKIADGSETSVQYTIGSASRSCYKLIAADNITPVSPLDIANSQHVNSSSSSYTTPSVTTTAGRRLAVGVMGANNAANLFTDANTWLNSYVDQGHGTSTSTPGLITAHGTLIFDGGGSTSTGASYMGAAGVARSGHIAVFKVATGGGAPALPPILVMAPRRP